MKQPLLSLRPLSVSLLLSLVFVFHSVYPLDNSYDEESDLIGQKITECGIPDIDFEPRIDSRIVGGVEATPHSWPWQALIRCLKNDGIRYRCGGSVLNSRWVITAAHCVNGVRDPDDCQIVLGQHNKAMEEKTVQKFISKRIIKHKYYNRKTFNNDIALIRLSEDVEFNRYVKPICLPDEDVEDGTYCVATGWGKTYSTGNQNVLNQVYVKVINNTVCNKRDWYGGNVTDNMICAGYADGGRDSCQGDSGGPLVSLSEGKWQLDGVTSWGWGCAKPLLPGLYTRVTNYLDWIQRKTKQHN